MRTVLDLILDRVTSRHEVTIATEGYTREQVERVLTTAKGRGLNVSYDGRFILIRAIRTEGIPC